MVEAKCEVIVIKNIYPKPFGNIGVLLVLFLSKWFLRNTYLFGFRPAFC